MYIYLSITLIMLAVIIAISLVLAHSLKDTLYAVKNIGLIGMLIGLVTALISLIADWFIYGVRGEPVKALLTLGYEFPRSFAFLYVGFLIILCILMGISNVELMRREGARPKNLVGTLLELPFILGTFAVYIVAQMMALADTYTTAPGLDWITDAVPLFLYALIDYGECLIIAMLIMGFVAARQKPTYDRDYIIILGCSIRKDGGLKPLLKGRANRAIRYAWDQEIASGKPVKFVPSGGKGSDEVMSEGSAMALYLMSHGAEYDEILPEKKSMNTYENFVFSKKLIDAEKPDAKIAFATTNYHMLRSGMLARKIGIADIEGIASDTKWYFWPNGFAREIVAIMAMLENYHIAAIIVMMVVCGVFAVLI